MEVINNKKNFQFEITDESGEIATLQYRWLKGNMVLMHTYVPGSLRGKGLANDLARFALENVRQNNIKAIVYCPFVKHFISRHQEYEILVSK